MKLWNWLFGRKKEQSKRKKKILLWILIPVSLVVVATGVFVSYLYGCKRTHSPALSTPPITQGTIEEDYGKYKVSAGRAIWLNDYLPLTFGHDLFNLKLWSINHNNTTEFIVDGTINFGFLVDFDMDCHLIGENNMLMLTDSTGACGCGVVVGSRDQPSSVVVYSGNMNIEPSMTLNITFHGENHSDLLGIIIYVPITSYVTINGTFNISGNSVCRGVYIGSTITDGSSLIINGNFSIYDFDSDGWNFACGVYFNSNIDGSVIINGNFTIFASNDSTSGVYFGDTCNHIYFIDISATFALSGSVTYGVNFFGDIDTSYIRIIDSTFTIISSFISYDGVSHSYSILFGSVTNSTLIMDTTTQFFSNTVDTGNIFSAISDWIGSYKWNGATISGSNNSAADSSLTLVDISDNDVNPNFTIKVIGADGKSGDSKAEFNTKYKSALQAYVNTCGDSAAKSWLENIINNIPL